MLILGGIVLFFTLCFIPPLNNFIYCLKVQAYLGSTTAMFKLVEIDGRQNYYWLLMAANKGNAEAIIGVGNLNRPKPEALVWYRKGAALGDVACMVEVGKAYQYGLYGEAVNKAEAKRWFDKADALCLEDKRKHRR
jgi:TPR repeat protein